MNTPLNPSTPAVPPPSRRNLSVSMEQANVLSLVIVLPIVIALAAVYLAIWGVDGLTEGFRSLFGTVLLFLLVFLVGILVHEAIHGLAWAGFGRVPLRAIRFGFQWKTLTPYAHCSVPLEVNAYRWGAFFPGLLTGFVPAVLGIFTGSGFLLVLGLLFVTAASGDLLILWLIRAVPAGSRVEDHPSRAGCLVLEESSPSGA